MKTQAMLFSLLLMAGCAHTVAPHNEERFGDAVRNARLAMTIEPNAGERGGPVAGIDGRAAQESMKRYQDSFKTPPRVTNVINIGGTFGSGGDGGGGGGGEGGR
jgi:hypothetical protein